MVGHTGDIEATVVACKAADEAVKVRTNKKLQCFVYMIYILKVELGHSFSDKFSEFYLICLLLICIIGSP